MNSEGGFCWVRICGYLRYGMLDWFKERVKGTYSVWMSVLRRVMGGGIRKDMFIKENIV